MARRGVLTTVSRSSVLPGLRRRFPGRAGFLDAYVANDVTAIDAVTADSANMAEDVDIAFTNEVTGEEEGANGASSSSKPKAAPNQTKPSTGSTATAASRVPAKDTAGGTPTTNSAE